MTGVLDALDEAVYRHPRHLPRVLRMTAGTFAQLVAEGLTEGRQTVAGFRVELDEALSEGEIK